MEKDMASERQRKPRLTRPAIKATLKAIDYYLSEFDATMVDPQAWSRRERGLWQARASLRSRLDTPPRKRLTTKGE